MEQPELLPEFVSELTQWTKDKAPALWLYKALSGAPFYWPKSIGNPTESAHAIGDFAYRQALKSYRGDLAKAQEAKHAVESTQFVGGLAQLAQYHAETLDRAYVLGIGKDITYLAAKTEMKEYRLTVDLLPKPYGIIFWETPIGEAEPRGMITTEYWKDSGKVVNITQVEDMMEGYRNSDTPIVAASWRLLPEEESVLVVFYTDGEKSRALYREMREEQIRNLEEGFRVDETQFQLQMSDPLPMEREQVLPLNKTLGWFHEKDKAERLTSTVKSDPTYLPESFKDAEVLDKFTEANEQILPVLSQMVKTFISTLHLRKMKLASREEIPAPAKSQKRMKRSQVNPERVASKVEVVRIGKPLQHREKGSGTGKGGKWKVKTVIGPVIRYRQYVPAYDEYREYPEGKMIEPYVAGPADAPWSDKARIYLLE
ncbi:hypothetical protein ADL27_32530 [Streptomyces sp. NRRL F-6602]|nr:hypothetical protein ADL27_32530 [Streptomyces sp. NRRL F-6602]